MNKFGQLDEYDKISRWISGNMPKISKILLLWGLGFYLVGNYLRGTEITNNFAGITSLSLFRLSQLGVILVVFKIILFDNHSYRFIGVFLASSCLLYYICSNAQLLDPFYYFVMIVGTLKFEYKTILQLYLWVCSIVAICLGTLTITGQLENMTMARPGSDLRMSFGSVTPSDFAAHIFNLMLAYAVYKKFKFNIWEYGLAIVTFFLTFKYTGTRLDVILMFLLLCCVTFLKPLSQLLNYVGTQIVAWFIVVYLAANVFITATFNNNNKFWNMLDNLLSHRLTYANTALIKYPITLWGQYIPQNGNGKFNPKEPYFFIDSSIIRILMMNGIIFFICLIIFILMLANRAMQQQQYYLVLALFLTLISAAIDHHFLEISYNIILLAAGAQIISSENADVQPNLRSYSDSMMDEI